MKITRRIIQYGGVDTIVAFIDTEGLVAIDGYDTTFIDQPYGGTIASIVDEDNSDEVINLPPVMDTDGTINLNNLWFRMDTYNKVKATQELWDKLLLAANTFLQLLTEEEQQLFCGFYIRTRRTIDRDLCHGMITEVSTEIGNDFYDLAIKIGLADKIIDYVKYQSGIPIPPLAYAGTNEGRDRPELTFKEEEYYLLLAISVVAKLLCPIWGDLIVRICGGSDKALKQVDNEMKEAHCINVIEPFLSLTRFRAVREKLYNYVTNTVNTTMNSSYKTASFTATIGGVSKNKFYHVIFSALIIKKYVIIDLYTPVGEDGRNGNITVWTWTSIKHSFQALQTTLNKKCHIIPRSDISESYDGDDDKKISYLEHGSHITEVTADIPVLIKFGVRMAIKRLCLEHNISESDYNTVLSYYKENLVQVTAFNKILIGVLLGSYIGGAQGLKYLDVTIYTELLTITQIYIATQQSTPTDVVHLLTSSTSDDEKPVLELTSTNTMIITSSHQTREYRQCEESFKYSIGKVSITATLKRLQDCIVKYPHFTNTAPLICALMDQEPIPHGELIRYEPDVMQRCCEIILGIIAPKGARIIKEKQSFMDI